jgi:carbon monoxide dehydrogenase subunit G
MSITFANEFVVRAPLETTWETLLDIERVASCMPGAKLESVDAEGVSEGTMKVKLGPISIAYRGSVQLGDVDARTHACTLDIKAKEQRGSGTASATITNRLSEVEGGTKVQVDTDLSVTGRAAQFGRGIMEEVAAKMLDDFAQRLEAEIVRPTATEPAPEDPPAATATEPGEPDHAAQKDDVLDLGSVAGAAVAKRAAIAGGVIIAVLLILLGRRRRS